MKMLKIVRVALSIIFFALISLIFIDYYRLIPVWVKSGATYLQLIPSMLSFFVSASLAGGGFFIVFTITLLFGRIYCSFICPLGFCQDVFIRAGRKFTRGKKYRYSSPHNIMFYGILSVSVISIVASGTALVLWLDPFSIFGRFMTYVSSGMVFSINNILASVLIERNIFILNSFGIIPSISGAVFALSVFTMVMTIALFKGRFYCNTICPAGALLSILSRVSLFKISFNASSCISCGKCESVCKSSCIDYKSKVIDFSRCVTCYNCIKECPNASVGYGLRYFRKNENRPAEEKNAGANGTGSITRFSFISGLLVLPAALIARNKDSRLYYQDSSKQIKFIRKRFSSPPGSSSVEIFNSRCTACSLCVSVCPTSVLQPAVMQYGLTGIMQPFMDFSKGYCNYDCVLCGEVCPAGAIKKLPVEEKKIIQTGKSAFIKENCITYTNATDCGACSEHCPTKAVHMVPFRDKLVIPEVNSDLCTGCGACEHVCPVRPYRAIYVEGNNIHAAAKLPEVKKKTEVKKSDFPF